MIIGEYGVATRPNLSAAVQEQAQIIRKAAKWVIFGILTGSMPDRLEVLLARIDVAGRSQGSHGREQERQHQKGEGERD